MHHSHSISRRTLLIGLFTVVALALAGMIWATHTTLELDFQRQIFEQDRRLTEHRKEFGDKVAFAMYRLDEIDGRFRKEKEHSFDVFKPFYRPPDAIDPRNGSEITAPFLLRSPLQTIDEPDWLLLHFQTMAPDGWDSPQVSSGDEYTLPASAFPAEDRAQHATASNWLSALRTQYDPLRLQELLEEAQIAYLNYGEDVGVAVEVEPPGVESTTVIDSEIEPSRAVQEFNRRGERLRDRHGRHVHTESCERQSIIKANLLPGHVPSVEIDPVEDCQAVVGTPMIPVWVDLTMDDNIQLAMMRSVSLPRTDVTEPSCVVQGVLFDWTRLQQVLTQEVQDLLPGARISPVREWTAPKSNRLHTIPAELIAEMPELPSKTLSASYDVVWGLTLTWVILLAALGGIFYGTIKYLGLLERRMRFTAAVTHELRTPLTSFQLYTDLLGELDPDDHARRDKYIGTLRSESKRLANLVENVLVYSKVNDAATRIHTKSVSPKQILDALRDETDRRCTESQRSLVINDKTDSQTQLETDPEFVRQILASLVDNACKYSESTGPIWIDASTTRGGGVLFEVDDAGRGVDPHETRAIFEPFRRGRDADRAKSGGMGLGLALSRYWAACLDGRLSVKRSERNGGHYSRFALDLPARPRES